MTDRWQSPAKIQFINATVNMLTSSLGVVQSSARRAHAPQANHSDDKDPVSELLQHTAGHSKEAKHCISAHRITEFTLQALDCSSTMRFVQQVKATRYG